MTLRKRRNIRNSNSGTLPNGGLNRKIQQQKSNLGTASQERKRERNKEGKLVSEEKEEERSNVESGKEERTIGTSLERKAIGELQIPLRPSFSLHTRKSITKICV